MKNEDIKRLEYMEGTRLWKRLHAVEKRIEDLEDSLEQLGRATELASLYLDVRDGLAFHQMRGDQLTALEQLLLRMLNVLAEQLLPQPEVLPRDVRDAMEEVRRMTKR